MTTHTRDIEQHYWRNAKAPHVEIRNTRNSTVGYKAHSHAELSLGVLESGQTCLTNQLTQGDTDLILSTGDMILIPPGLVHACNPIGTQARGYHMIYLKADWCLETLSQIYERQISDLPRDPVLIQNPDLADTYFSIARSLNTDTPELTRLDSFLFQILASYCDVNAQTPEQSDLPKHTRQALLRDLAEPPSLDHLAQHFNTTAETIIRNFKKAYGITPKAFLHNARIEKAKVLLRSGMPIVETALEVGYADQSQFHKAFVAFCAATPRQYQDARPY